MAKNTVSKCRASSSAIRRLATTTGVHAMKGRPGCSVSHHRAHASETSPACGNFSVGDHKYTVKLGPDGCTVEHAVGSLSRSSLMGRDPSVRVCTVIGTGIGALVVVWARGVGSRLAGPG